MDRIWDATMTTSPHQRVADHTEHAAEATDDELAAEMSAAAEAALAQKDRMDLERLAGGQMRAAQVRSC